MVYIGMPRLSSGESATHCCDRRLILSPCFSRGDGWNAPMLHDRTIKTLGVNSGPVIPHHAILLLTDINTNLSQQTTQKPGSYHASREPHGWFRGMRSSPSGEASRPRCRARSQGGVPGDYLVQGLVPRGRSLWNVEIFFVFLF